MFSIIQAQTPAHIDTARALFTEYETALDLDLCFQGFEAELRDLPGKYALPTGRLLLAFDDDMAAGCIAMRALADGVCEMKRLFVRDEFKGKGIGRALIDALIAAAREEGYSKMRLDTFPPKMAKAVSLYEAYGFREIAPYYNNPNEGVLYMELDL